MRSVLLCSEREWGESRRSGRKPGPLWVFGWRCDVHLIPLPFMDPKRPLASMWSGKDFHTRVLLRYMCFCSLIRSFKELATVSLIIPLCWCVSGSVCSGSEGCLQNSYILLYERESGFSGDCSTSNQWTSRGRWNLGFDIYHPHPHLSRPHSPRTNRRDTMTSKVKKKNSRLNWLSSSFIQFLEGQEGPQLFPDHQSEARLTSLVNYL